MDAGHLVPDGENGHAQILGSHGSGVDPAWFGRPLQWTAMLRTIEVVPYDPAWAATFESLRERLATVVGGRCIGIEHVGSTSVPGLAAKPVIDIDIVISSRVVFPAVREALHEAGYSHRGNLEIPGREAFLQPPKLPRHNLYVCSVDAPGLHDHLVLRDMLRTRPDLCQRYAATKREMARLHPHDIDAYIDGKAAVIAEIMALARAQTSFEHFQPGPAPHPRE
jgi:GrpB-like predicted nucleotidyltransferase (UPF0157 family)